MDWARLLSEHGLAVFLVLAFVVGIWRGARTVWRYLTTVLIPKVFGDLELKIDRHGGKVDDLSGKIEGLTDAVDVGTALTVVEMKAELSDDDFRGAFAKVKALRKISNGG